MQEDVFVKRPAPAEGYVDEEGNWVTSAEVAEIIMKGSIQPYTSTDISDGRDTIPMRSGFDSSAARIIFTDQLVRGVDRKKQQEPDYIDYEDDEWICWRVYNNLNSPLIELRHCESVWVRRSALEES